MNTIVVVSTLFATTLFLVLTLVDLGTRDMVTDIEDGEIVAGGSVSITVGDGGERTVSRGAYNPWYSDTPGMSVLDQARADYKAAKHGDDHGTEAKDDGEGQAGGEAQAADGQPEQEAESGESVDDSGDGAEMSDGAEASGG
jgi:hypothetical protein